MAALRNLAIGALRLTGRADIAEATRWPAADPVGHSSSPDSRHDLDTAVVGRR
jgi:hypothetical protein